MDPMELREIPIRINWLAKPARIAEALGLNVVLPDLEIEDSGYWECFDRDAWRKELRGKVAMTDEELRRIDADWVRLKQFGQYAEVWFNIEEGIVIRCKAADAVASWSSFEHSQRATRFRSTQRTSR